MLRRVHGRMKLGQGQKTACRPPAPEPTFQWSQCNKRPVKLILRVGARGAGSANSIVGSKAIVDPPLAIMVVLRAGIVFESDARSAALTLHNVPLAESDGEEKGWSCRVRGEDNVGMDQSQGCCSSEGRMHNVVAGAVGGGGQGNDGDIGIDSPGATIFVKQPLTGWHQLLPFLQHQPKPVLPRLIDECPRPTMPPKLNHRKSVRGCRNCKRRKVKCDEKQPECSACIRHFVVCEYPDLQTIIHSYKPPRQQRQSSSRPAPLRRTLPSPERANLNPTDLQLIHHYVTATAHTMGHAQLPPVLAIWQLAVPEMAFEYPPLLHTILAVAATHRAALLPDTADVATKRLRAAHHLHIDRALKHHRAETARVNRPGTVVSEALCMNTILICLYALTLRGGRADSETTNSCTTYEPPLLWLHMSRGIRLMIGRAYHGLVGAKARIAPLLMAKPLVHRGAATAAITSRVVVAITVPASTSHTSNDNNNANNMSNGSSSGSSGLRPLYFLLDCNPDEEGETAEIRAVYDECVKYLEGMYVAVVDRGEAGFDLRKRFSSFGPMTPAPFVGLVADRRPRALVILAYLFALAKGAEEVWWLKGIPEREVRGIYGVLSVRWKGAMLWAVEYVTGGGSWGLGEKGAKGAVVG
ncbi:hypothetical protein ASPACDRAFT_43714 [Aspergillus aculeatus ATCC 16872]|uniref:Zn(2)-C6 fungal-type domain-containing protein n=1 Tax=Aspergillus aculeatus (strain ATCC 16872 / CBS 172.66 / WB 5094) TaxID=690307 RepID=A0A1L9WS81_ASPA1|nr:uncharacterized protein ASPACDRAFT_43714 [Aspergillus aculeatus ATCC 16872]OJJ99055.1 hypothetical protein ASPACDRAFT_43714 [Aspergillus aculeatus ATCC 16872]